MVALLSGTSAIQLSDVKVTTTPANLSQNQILAKDISENQKKLFKHIQKKEKMNGQIKIFDMNSEKDK